MAYIDEHDNYVNIADKIFDCIGFVQFCHEITDDIDKESVISSDIDEDAIKLYETKLMARNILLKKIESNLKKIETEFKVIWEYRKEAAY